MWSKNTIARYRRFCWNNQTTTPEDKIFRAPLTLSDSLKRIYYSLINKIFAYITQNFCWVAEAKIFIHFHFKQVLLCSLASSCYEIKCFLSTAISWQSNYSVEIWFLLGGTFKLGVAKCFWQFKINDDDELSYIE